MTAPEPSGHLVHERTTAEAEQRSCRNFYREVPLTGCQQSMMPTYRLPQAFGRMSVLDEYGLCEQTSDARELGCAGAPWVEEENGKISGFRLPDARKASADNLERDAQTWAK